MMSERVLVLDGRTIEALACVRSLGRAGYWVAVGGKLRWPLASWSRYCRARFHYPKETLAGFAALRTWAHRNEIRVVLPLTEATSQLCNAERGEWEALGIVVGCAPDAVLMSAFDKAETLRRAAACGVDIPPTRFPTSLSECRAAAATLGYPCLIKPRFTRAWNGHGFLPDLGPTYAHPPPELEAAVRSRRQGEYWPLIQAFVSGQGKGVFTVCDHGRPLAWFAHERLRDVRPSGSGSSLRRSVALDPRLQARAERLLCEMQWHGPAMVEFRDDGTGAPWLMEVNGRFWGSLQLSIAAGRDFPRLWIEILTAKPVQPPAAYREGVTLRWLWGDVKRLLYILAGRPAGYPGAYPSVAEGLREMFGRQPPGTRLEAWDRKPQLRLAHAHHVRDDTLRRPANRKLAPAVANLEIVRQGNAVLHHVVIQEGHARLERERHGGPVLHAEQHGQGIDEDVVQLHPLHDACVRVPEALLRRVAPPPSGRGALPSHDAIPVGADRPPEQPVDAEQPPELPRQVAIPVPNVQHVGVALQHHRAAFLQQARQPA